VRQAQRRGNSRAGNRGTANRAARRNRPGRPVAYLYRDRRRRRFRRQLVCLALLALALALAVILILRRLPGPGVAPTPAPTPTPAATPSPEPTVTASPTLALTPTPVSTRAPSATPLTLTGPDVAESRPTLDIFTQDDLIAVLRWMIHEGRSTVQLDSIALSDRQVAEVMDPFSNYFDSYGLEAGSARVGVRLKAGVKLLPALLEGREDQLEDAERARAAVDALVRPGMTDVEKELAIHDYISAHCQYQYNDQGENAQSALGFFNDGRCSCAGYVDTFRLLAGLAGLDVEMIGGPTTRDAPGEKGHAWNLVRLDGLWYAVDVTWDDMLGDASAEHVFFNLPFTSFTGYRKTDSRYCPPGDYAVLVDDKYYFNTPDYAAATLEEALALATRQLDAGGPAYVYFTGEDLSYALNAALVQRYSGKLKITELSEDLTLSVYRYAL